MTRVTGPGGPCLNQGPYLLVLLLIGTDTAFGVILFFSRGKAKGAFPPRISLLITFSFAATSPRQILKKAPNSGGASFSKPLKVTGLSTVSNA